MGNETKFLSDILEKPCCENSRAFLQQKSEVLREFQFLDALAADVFAAKQSNTFGIIAENAGGLVFFQHNR